VAKGRVEFEGGGVWGGNRGKDRGGKGREVVGWGGRGRGGRRGAGGSTGRGKGRGVKGMC